LPGPVWRTHDANQDRARHQEARNRYQQGNDLSTGQQDDTRRGSRGPNQEAADHEQCRESNRRDPTHGPPQSSKVQQAEPKTASCGQQ